MQNGDKALPRQFVVAKPSQRFEYLCLDNVRIY